MDAKWSPDRVRLELYALIDRRLVAIEAAIAAIGTIAAIDVTVAPTVDLISTNVQAALEELQAEILALSGSALTGAGAATQVAFWTTPTNLSSEALFQWDPVNKRLGVNTIVPAQTLDVRGVARITGSSGTATSLMGRDINGDVSAITVGASMSLVGNILEANILSRTILNVSSNVAAGGVPNTDYYYLCSNTMTLTLPTAIGNTNRYAIKNVGSGAVTVATSLSQTIDGAATAVINFTNNSIDIISDGANWNII